MHVAAGFVDAIRPDAQHPLEIMHVGHRRFVARLAAGHQMAVLADLAQQFHLPLSALASV